MTYLVLARKYRPQTFSEVVGQEHVTRTLANAFASGRVHHAFLFCGPRGCGKTTLARIVGKALNCEQGPSAQPCGVCGGCTSISGGSAIDYQEMDGASNRGIDAIRELTEAVRYQPAVLRKKVYVIDEVHMLTTEAFNALLKTLEEPPPHVTFVLATTEPHKLPNTILSRCQRYDFKLVPASRLAAHLVKIFEAEQLPIEPGAVSLLVRESGGSVRDALSLSDQLISYVGAETITERNVAEVLGVADRSLTRTLVRALASGEAGTALSAVESAIERGVDEIQLARAIVRYLRDLSVLQVAPERPELIDAADEERAELGVEASSLDRSRVAQMFERMLRCCDELGKTLQPRLVLDCALIDVATVEPLIPLGDLVERLGEIEARLTRGGAQPARPAQAPRAPQAPSQAPAHQAPAHQAPSRQTPAHQANQAASNQAPAQANQPPANQAPANQASANQAANQAPANQAPAHQAPAHAPIAPRAEPPAMSMTAQLEQHLEATAGGGAQTRTVVSAVADAGGRKQAPAFATGTAPGQRAPQAPPATEQALGASKPAPAAPAGESAGPARDVDGGKDTPATAKSPGPDKSKLKRKPEFADGSGVRGGESNDRAPGKPEMAAGTGVRGGDEVAAAIDAARAARDAAIAESKMPEMSGHAMADIPHAAGSRPDPQSGSRSDASRAAVPNAKSSGVSGPVSMQPSGPVPALSSVASGSGPTEQLTAAPTDVLKAWNAVLGELETRRRFTLLGPFQHARVMKWGADLIELGFPVDVHSMGEMAAEKTNIDELCAIVRELGAELARVKLTVRLLDASESSQGTRSSLEATRERTTIERGKREIEAREHPITKHVLQTFGAQIKEIKTDV